MRQSRFGLQHQMKIQNEGFLFEHRKDSVRLKKNPFNQATVNNIRDFLHEFIIHETFYAVTQHFLMNAGA